MEADSGMNAPLQVVAVGPKRHPLHIAFDAKQGATGNGKHSSTHADERDFNRQALGCLYSRGDPPNVSRCREIGAARLDSQMALPA